MCSEGVSVWFACKLCKSFFLNADDFAYHKKKSHIQEFRNTKFLVFEEQTSPTASPPENWVSFFSPKEERHIHKIISSPSPPTTTNLEYNLRNENIPNKEFVEIDLESNKVLIFNNQDEESDAAAHADVTNNCFELNSAPNSYSDVDILQNQLLQSRAEPPSVGCDFTDKTRDKQCSTVIKSNSLKISQQNKKIQPVPSSSNVLQTIIQSPDNPYVYMKRLNMITVQNASPQPNNSAAHSQENVRSHVKNGEPAIHEPKVTHEDQNKFCRSYSASISPPLETIKPHRTELGDDFEAARKKQIQSDFVSSICNNSRETNLLSLATNHGDQTVYKTDCNPDLDLGPVSNGDDFNGVLDPRTEVNLNYGDLLEVVKTEYVADGNEDSEFPDVNHDPLESESRDNALAEKRLILSDNLEETQASQIGFYCASCKIQFTHVQELKEHNKNHHVTPDGKKRFECPYPECETISNSHGEIKSHLRHVHSNIRPFKCPHPNCKMSFKTLGNKRDHLKLHTMGASKRKFDCPYPNCGKQTTSKCNLKIHIQHIHSSARPYKCPHPNCTQSFKAAAGMNAHLKRHAKWSKTK